MTPFDQFLLSDVGRDGMGGDSNTGGNAKANANFIGGGLDTKSREFRQPAVERAIVPEICFAAANAGVSRLDGETHTIVPFDHTTRIVGTGAFATNLIETVTSFGILIIERFDKQTGIEIRTAVTGIVHPA